MKIIVLAVAAIAGLAVVNSASASGDQLLKEERLVDERQIDERQHERHKAGWQSERAGLAEVTATFSEDSSGFRVASDKDLSNIIIEYCAAEDQERKEFGDGNLTYDHEGTRTVTGIWVKSGSYMDADGPSGAGYRFDNKAATCMTETTA